ncbi:hypothetical protein [Streptomyces tsukubensis]|uniref:hypothetical protein n=1 Tax=Streptomyces tsukubensis TaxID=83656 RepID=UPI00344D2C47
METSRMPDSAASFQAGPAVAQDQSGPAAVLHQDVGRQVVRDCREVPYRRATSATGEPSGISTTARKR